MTEDDIGIRLASGIIHAAGRIMGEDAIKVANEVQGLAVRTNGEIVVTGEVYTIIGNLCSVYEKALKGKLVVEVDVRLNLRRGNGV